jgi:hypothetical protein
MFCAWWVLLSYSLFYKWKFRFSLYLSQSIWYITFHCLCFNLFISYGTHSFIWMIHVCVLRTVNKKKLKRKKVMFMWGCTSITIYSSYQIPRCSESVHLIHIKTDRLSTWGPLVQVLFHDVIPIYHINHFHVKSYNLVDCLWFIFPSAAPQGI